MTKLQWVAGAAVLVAGALTGVVQYRANAALAQDVARLQAMSDDVAAEQRRVRAPTAGSEELEQLRAAAAELPELQARVRERLDVLQQRQMARAAAPLRQPRALAPAGPELPLAQLDVMPRPVKQVPPIYPATLREFGITGRVVVSFVIGSDGAVADAKVRSSTHGTFDAPALAALAEWKYAPGQKAGVAVNTRVEVALVFTMQRDTDDWF